MVGQRWHRKLAHTADVGFRAAAPDRPALFEEAAVALAEIAADIRTPAQVEPEAVAVAAEDLPALVCAWLNELIGLAEVRGEALVRAEAEAVTSAGDGWVVRGRAWFAPFDGASVRPRQQVKAATMHRLEVTEGSEGWMVEAYVDI